MARESRNKSPGEESLSNKKIKTEPEEGRVLDGSGGPRERAPAPAPAAGLGQTETSIPAAAPAAELSRFNVSYEVQLFHCWGDSCHEVLKPPVHQCEAGHLLCTTCRGAGHCRSCNRASTLVPCPVADAFVDGAMVPCPFEASGCDRSVPYHDVLAHREACAYAPCCCLVPGCAFAASPPKLRDHLTAAHSWPVHKISAYSKAYALCVPAEDAQRLLVVEGDAPRMFLLSLRRCGAAVAVSVACVRASSAAAGPHFKCCLWAEGPTLPDLPRQMQDRVMVEVAVRNCVVPGGLDLTTGTWLHVVPEMLQGPSRDVAFKIRIEEIRPVSTPVSGSASAIPHRYVRLLLSSPRSASAGTESTQPE